MEHDPRTRRGARHTLMDLLKDLRHDASCRHLGERLTRHSRASHSRASHLSHDGGAAPAQAGLELRALGRRQAVQSLRGNPTQQPVVWHGRGMGTEWEWNGRGMGGGHGSSGRVASRIVCRVSRTW
jgi:hypothetical protein